MVPGITGRYKSVMIPLAQRRADGNVALRDPDRLAGDRFDKRTITVFLGILARDHGRRALSAW